jgi:hypothetical protein
VLQECLDELASFLMEYAGKTWPGQGQRTKDAVYVSTFNVVQLLGCLLVLKVVDKGLSYLFLLIFFLAVYRIIHRNFYFADLWPNQ